MSTGILVTMTQLMFPCARCDRVEQLVEGSDGRCLRCHMGWVQALREERELPLTLFEVEAAA